MNRYRINRVGINNFKIFSKYFERSFESNDLIVLDGPNGFGKTSIFDAIELVLTGIIKRLDIYDESVKNKMKAYGFPFINNENADFYIKIELSSDAGDLIICRYLKRDQIGQKNKGKIRWDRIRLGKLNSWDDCFENATDLNQKELEGLLGVKDLDRIFNIFFYVQQEENTFFLKRSENERKQYLNILFDVDRETKIFEKIEKLLKFQKEYISEKNLEITQLKKSKLTIEYNNSIVSLPYVKIFEHIEYEWDKESPNFTDFTYKNVVDVIQNIEKLFDSINDFKRQKEALKIKSFLSSPNFIKNYSLIQVYENVFPQIEKRVNEGKELKLIQKSIEQHKIFDINFWIIRKEFLSSHTSVDIQNLLDQVQLYADQKSNHDKLENVRTEINQHRKNLIEKYNTYINISDDNQEKECPLCGNEWENLQKLLDGMNDAEKRFMTTNQASLKLILDKITYHCNKIMDDIQKLLNTTYYPEEEILTLIRISVRSKQNFVELNNFIERNNLKISDLDRLKSLDDVKMLEEVSTKFQESLVNNIENMLVIDHETFIGFESIFTQYFKESFDKLQTINISKLNEKIKYIGVKYIEYSNSQNKEIGNNIDKIQVEIQSVIEKVEKIKKVKGVYEKKIKEHISKIINDISIPFFINSGRILQEFHGGNGIFVKMGGGKSDGVKFYTDIDMENDPLYSLSSGQISSLVLAFCLTLNDVYREHFLGMILIDDPIQTMDEINTITFIDLIRNNFNDRQFIISTHEDNFSSLIRYKFKQNNSQVSVIRMQEAI